MIRFKFPPRLLLQDSPPEQERHIPM